MRFFNFVVTEIYSLKCRARAAMRAVAFAACVAVLVQAGPAAARNASDAGLFETGAPVSTDFSGISQWGEVQQRYRQEAGQAAEACRWWLFRRCPLANWSRALDRLQDAEPLQQLAAVNSYVNRVNYVDDETNYGAGDYWATPREFMTRGGDCEDYAVAKYLSLRALGFRDADMQIVALYDVNSRIHHAVLAVRVEGRTLVLDNRSGDIVPAATAAGYRAIYAVNEGGWWLHRG